MEERILIEVGAPEDGRYPVREAGTERSGAPGATVVPGTREELERWAGAAERHRAATRPPGARGRVIRALGRGPVAATRADEAYRPVAAEIAARLAEHRERREAALRTARAQRFRAGADRPVWGLLAPAALGPVRVFRWDAEVPPEADPTAARLTVRELEHGLLELRTQRTQAVEWYGTACEATEAECAATGDRVSFPSWWAAVTLFPWQHHRWLPSLPGSPAGPVGRGGEAAGAVGGFGCGGGAGCGGAGCGGGL
ncbi:hypothetical protein GCM10020229_41650 [Kitasatospora albolonga]|uniref:hypothetical protein n=1 Tax=Kitasatospora albolonga TaxID=68173 RepID=UPI0031E5B4C4